MGEKSPAKLFVIVGSGVVLVLVILIVALTAGGRFKKNDDNTTESSSFSVSHSGKHRLGSSGGAGFEETESGSTTGTHSTIGTTGAAGGRSFTGVSVPSTAAATATRPVTGGAASTTRPSQAAGQQNGGLQSVSLASFPSKTTYYIGDKISLDGMVVIARYGNGTQRDVSSAVTYRSPDMHRAGSANVTVSYKEGGITKTLTYTINIKKPSVSISPNEKNICIGDTASLTASVSPSNCTVSWKSASSSIASVNQNGVVKGEDTGKTTITASITYNGITYYSDGCLVAVAQKNSDIGIYDLDWDGEYTSSELSVDSITGTITSNYNLAYIEVGLIGPVYVNGKYMEEYEQSFYLKESNLDGRTYDMKDFGPCEFDIISGEEYMFYVYAEDTNGGSNIDGWFWQGED